MKSDTHVKMGIAFLFLVGKNYVFYIKEGIKIEYYLFDRLDGLL